MITLQEIANLSPEEILQKLQTSPEGLTDQEAKKRLESYGKNLIETKKKENVFTLFLSQFKSPLTLMLIFVSIFSFVLRNRIDASIIFIIILMSVMLGFIQEKRAKDTIRRLLVIVKTTFTVIRKSNQKQVYIENIVPGDIVLLKSGDMIPADCLILEEKDLFVDEAPLTGESIPVEKTVKISKKETSHKSERSHLLFMGSHIISGTGKAVVLITGKKTEFGKIAEKVAQRAPEPSYERGIRHFGYLLMEITFVFIFVIFILNLYLQHPLIDSLLFSLAIAIGFTPQLLPMIITVNLAQGAKHMAQKKVIIKKLSSIENFGSMNILCCDKTGTLTRGVVELYATLDYEGKESDLAQLYASVNASFQTGYPNPLDTIILHKFPLKDKSWEKIDELPYDFSRKCITVLAKHDKENLLIVKGAFQTILQRCTKVQASPQKIIDLSDVKKTLEVFFASESQKGYRILGLAYKPSEQKSLTIQDESNLIFLGFLLFFDPPKAHVPETLKKLMDLGIILKMITGDNRYVAGFVAEKIGLPNPQIVIGEELDRMSDHALHKMAKTCDVFAEINPIQKERIIRVLKKYGNTVGYLGDGLNDAIAFHAGDVGISVNTASPYIKDRADIVLLDKNLAILLDGVKEGRKTVANTMKYILMATSANFGNMLSMSGASLFLNFFPLLPKQILLNNLLTDFAEVSISTDSVDPEMELKAPKWDLKWLLKFMVVFGAASSIFDFITFGGLFYFFKASDIEFRTAWFIESVLSATLIILFIRTRKPFYQSRPSNYLLLTVFAVVIIAAFSPWTPLAYFFEFIPISFSLFGFIFAIIIGYMGFIEFIKYFFYKKINSNGVKSI